MVEILSKREKLGSGCCVQEGNGVEAHALHVRARQRSNDRLYKRKKEGCLNHDVKFGCNSNSCCFSLSILFDLLPFHASVVLKDQSLPYLPPKSR
jgi:hypothetical protein